VLLSVSSGQFRLIGRYETFTSPVAIWYRVDTHRDTAGQTSSVSGWVADTVFNSLEPCIAPTGVTAGDLPILDSNGNPLVTPTFTPTRTPTYTPTPVNSIQAIIDDLATYGLTVFAAGVDSGQSNGQAWTLVELQQLQLGVQNIASAFNRFKYSDQSGTNSSARSLFASIMRNTSPVSNLKILRVSNSFSFGGGDNCNGTTDAGCTSNANNAIALYGTFYFNVSNQVDITKAQYTIVHEFGHRFDNQSRVGVPAADSLFGRTDTGFIFDCQSGVVLGRIFGSSDWLRGIRGWGDTVNTAVPPYHSDFQQNAAVDVDSVEIGEAVADMFLNWVYRRITDSAPTGDRCTTSVQVGTWQGFRNINGSGTFDATLPGNARYWWMEEQLAAIFAQHNTWQ